MEAAKKRARAAGDGEQSVETEGEDERRDGRLASDRPPEKRARLQSAETKEDERRSTTLVATSVMLLGGRWCCSLAPYWPPHGCPELRLWATVMTHLN